MRISFERGIGPSKRPPRGGRWLAVVVAAAIAAAVAPALDARADGAKTEKTDLAVGFHTFALLSPKWTGNVPAAIVYDPGNADSKADAENIKSLIDGGVGAPGVQLVPSLVAVTDLGKIGRPADGAGVAVILTAGLSKEKMAAAGEAAKKAGALSMSVDLDCVGSGYCVLGLVSKPGIKILYNDHVAKSSGIIFIDAFALMAKAV